MTTWAIGLSLVAWGTAPLQASQCTRAPLEQLTAALNAGRELAPQAPGEELTPRKTSSLSPPEQVQVGDAQLCWSRFSYHSVPGQDYGAGLGVWRLADQRLTLVALAEFDHGVHAVSWRDLNGDAVPDLYFLAGEDEVMNTYIYVTVGEPGEMSLAYEHDNAYATIIDPDGDGYPEVLDSGPVGYTGCMECPPTCASFPEEATLASVQEYLDLTGEYRDMNFTYGMPVEYHGVGNIFPFYPVRIFKIVGDRAVETTHEHPDHLRWRLNLLRRLEPSSPECAELLQELTTYLSGQLGSSD